MPSNHRRKRKFQKGKKWKEIKKKPVVLSLFVDYQVQTCVCALWSTLHLCSDPASTSTPNSLLPLDLSCLVGKKVTHVQLFFHGSASSMENSHILALPNVGGEGCPPRLPFCLRQQTLSVPPLSHVPDFLLLASASLWGLSLVPEDHCAHLQGHWERQRINALQESLSTVTAETRSIMPKSLSVGITLRLAFYIGFQWD